MPVAVLIWQQQVRYLFDWTLHLSVPNLGRVPDFTYVEPLCGSFIQYEM